MLSLFLTFLKIGAFSFGGGYAMLPLIEREVVGKHRWIDEKSWADMVTIAQSAPGPIALNIAAFVGRTQRGVMGATVAVAGVVVPSFMVLLMVAIYLPGVAENRWVVAAFRGMRPAVIALVAAPLVKLCRGLRWWQIVAMVAVTGIIWLAGISPVWLLLTGAVVGVALRLNSEEKHN